MIFVKQVTPFINSLYEVHDLALDLDLIRIGVDKHLQNECSWTERGAGKQTDNLTEIIPEFKPLFDKLDEVTEEIVGSWGINTKPKLSLHFINIDENYSYSEVHCHANCILSGVFYLDVPEGSGSIKFYRPDSQEYQFKLQEYNNPHTNRKYTINPKPNMAIIFPSHIKHGVGVSKINQEESRISIAFDYIL